MVHLKYLSFIFILLAAAVMDMRSFKVSNRWTAFGFVFGAVIHISCGSPELFISGLAGLAAPMVLLVLYRYSMIGAADIKLFSMAGFYLGFIKGLEFTVITFVLAAVVSLYRVISHQYLKKRFFYFLSFIRDFSTNEKRIYMDFSDKDSAACIHMTVPMTVAAAVMYICTFL